MSLPTGTVAGDTITLTVVDPNGSDINVTATVPATWNGTDSIEVTVPAIVEGIYGATATVTDANGDASDVSNTANCIIDRTAPGEDSSDTISAPVITINESEPDNIVGETESLDGVQVQVPESTEAGDTLTLTLTQPDGTQVTVTDTVPSDWNGTDIIEVTVPQSDLPEDGVYTTVVTVTDSAGNESANSNVEDFNLLTNLPVLDPPVIAIAEADPDGLVNEEEASDGVTVAVTLPAGTVAGNDVTLTVVQPNGVEIDINTTVPNTWNGTDPLTLLFQQ